MWRRIASLISMAFVCAIGAIVGGWITNSIEPVQFQGRKVLTPIVAPGDDVEIQLDNYRVLRCPQTVFREVSYPNGRRTQVMLPRPENFGKLGRDIYTVGVETEKGNFRGPGTVYSYVERKCNPWEYWYPKISGPWVDKFTFGDKTVHVDPDDAPNTLLTK